LILRSAHRSIEDDFPKIGLFQQPARRAVRFSPELDRQIQKAAKDGGFRNTSAFIRTAIEYYMKSRNELSGIEEQNAASFDRLSKDDRRILRGPQALFAMVDALARVVVTCVPEPPMEARAQVIASAKDRYAKLMKSAGQALTKHTMSAMQELMDHVEE